MGGRESEFTFGSRGAPSASHRSGFTQVRAPSVSRRSGRSGRSRFDSGEYNGRSRGRYLAAEETVTGLSPVTNLVTLALLTIALGFVIFLTSNLKVKRNDEEETKGDEMV